MPGFEAPRFRFARCRSSSSRRTKQTSDVEHRKAEALCNGNETSIKVAREKRWQPWHKAAHYPLRFFRHLCRLR